MTSLWWIGFQFTAGLIVYSNVHSSPGDAEPHPRWAYVVLLAFAAVGWPYLLGGVTAVAVNDAQRRCDRIEKAVMLGGISPREDAND